jgi:DNA-binding CsgD family transcriptional regulator
MNQRTLELSDGAVLSGGGQFVATQEWKAICSHLKLSPREADIAALLLTDSTEAAVARELSISSHTVHSHLERLYRKLNVHSRCELVVRLFKAYIDLHETFRAGTCDSFSESP